MGYSNGPVDPKKQTRRMYGFYDSGADRVTGSHLVVDPLLDGPQVVAEVKVSCGLHSRNDALLDGDFQVTVFAHSDARATRTFSRQPRRSLLRFGGHADQALSTATSQARIESAV